MTYAVNVYLYCSYNGDCFQKNGLHNGKRHKFSLFTNFGSGNSVTFDRLSKEYFNPNCTVELSI